MDTIKQHMESPLQGALCQLAKAIGIPDSCVAEVVCVDCGKKTISAHCRWEIDVKAEKASGPHCGCISS